MKTTRTRRLVGAALGCVMVAAGVPAANGQEAAPATPADPTPAAATDPAAPSAAPAPPPPAADAGILPIPDYTGDLRRRRFLTGDWGGARAGLADNGVQLDLNLTQVLQSVVDGGRDTDTRFGGTLDYNLTLDLQRMGVMPGALVKFRAETRLGESVNGLSGSILPVNTDGFFPLTDRLDKDIPFTVTNLTYIQYLSEKFGLLLGKFDTLDGDPNEFASGRGTSQFLNANFVFNATSALTAPYSTLGAGVIYMPVKAVTLSSTVYNTADSSTTAGFEDFGSGSSWSSEARFQYHLGHLPGGQNAGFIYSFDNDFSRIGGRFVFRPGEGLVAPTTDETWSVYWSGWQYLYVEDTAEAPVDAANGAVDRQGLGLFARFGFADEDVNPVEWTLSGGVGGRGLIPTRDDDTFGIGCYYSRIQETRLGGILGLGEHTQGFEAFYNLAITPAASLTFDVQVADSVQQSVDNALIVGARLGLRF
jgi:porin